MNIAIFTDSFFPGIGGTEKAVFGLADALKKANHNVLVACPKYKIKENRNYDFFVLRAKSLKLTQNDYYAFPSLTKDFKKALQDFSPDIIHCQSVSPMASFAIKYAKKHNIPVIFTVHTKFRTAFSRSIKSKLIVNMLIKNITSKLNKAQKVFTVSNDMKQELLSYGYKKDVTVIRNGCTFDKSLINVKNKHLAQKTYNLKQKTYVLLYVGHIVKFKNLQFLLDAIKILTTKMKNFRLLMVGKGLDDEYFKKYVQDNDLTSFVTFTGEITDNNMLSSIYKNADLYLFPSIFDNDSLTIVESAFHKIPSLVIENTGSSERITNNVSGFLSKNDVAEYANNIKKILKDKKLLTDVGKNAKKMIPMEWSDTASMYQKEYEKLLKWQQKNAYTQIQT